MFQKCRDLWHTLSPAEQQTWESLARRDHMTGYAYYMSLCLRPNPGIYLPLAGGTMQGDIDMAGHRLKSLPTPAADDDSARAIDNRITWKEPAEIALYLPAQTSPINWTDLDLTAFTSSAAKFAILLVELYGGNYGTSGYNSLRIRKNGTSDSLVYIWFAYNQPIWNPVMATFILGLDANQIMEYRLKLASGTPSLYVRIKCLGYIE